MVSEFILVSEGYFLFKYFFSGPLVLLLQIWTVANNGLRPHCESKSSSI